MKIYQNEIKDGLKEQIEAKSSIAFVCDILSPFIIKPNNECVQHSLAFMGMDQKKQLDLYYLNSVLVSAGWNKNDDVFAVSELWDAKDTPVNKQFNYMHDDTDIIGHITGSIVVDIDGNTINDDVQDLPDHIDIITSAVIYKTWSDMEMRNRVAELISEIEQDKWSVSMECIFSHFDYAIISPNNSHGILSRSEESSFLTKHLRAYGGEGEYKGYKIGRLLRGFYFSGKGLVEKPANPRSVILRDGINSFQNMAKNIEFHNFLSATEVNGMAENQDQLHNLKVEADAKFETYKAEAEALHSKTVEDYEAKIDVRDNAIAELQLRINQLESEKVEQARLYSEKISEIDQLNSDKNSLAKENKALKRSNQLSNAGVSLDETESLLSKFEEASDSMFDSVVALLVNKPSAPKEDKAEMLKPMKDEEDEEEDEEDTEASLDEVEEVSSATLANPSHQEQNSAIASAAAWLRKSVLKSTKNL